MCVYIFGLPQLDYIARIGIARKHTLNPTFRHCSDRSKHPKQNQFAWAVFLCLSFFFFFPRWKGRACTHISRLNIVGSWVDKVSHWNLWSKLELALVSFKWCIYTNRTLSNSNCVCVCVCLLAWVRACCWLYARWAAANMNVSFSLLSWLFVEADDRDLKISLGAAPCLSSYSSAFLCPQSTSTPLIFRCFSDALIVLNGVC
jgi:hypothetical protein